MKKISALKIMTLAAILSCGGKALASDFDLSSLNVSDIRASQADIKAPAAQAQQLDGDDLIGIDLSIRVPFKMINRDVAQVAASEKRLTINDKSAPVVFKSGEFLKVSNITVDANGIIVVPTLTLKPYFEGRDKLAIRVQKIQLHASMEPSVKSAPAAIDQEEIMEQVMDVMIKGVYSAINAKLHAEHPMVKAEDFIVLKYDKAAWTLHAAISPKGLHNFIPAGIIGDLHLTGFTLTDSGLALKIQTAE